MSKKEIKISNGRPEAFDSFLARTMVPLAIWNCLCLIYAIISLTIDSKQVVFPSAYADFRRGDLFYLLVQGNFTNPYSFHPDIPDLRNQPYLPLPYLIIELFGIELTQFNPNFIWVHLTVILMILPIVVMFYASTKALPLHLRLSITLALAIFSPSALYLFTTGNVQSLVLGGLLIGVLLIKNSEKFRGYLIVVTAMIFATKPQFAFANALYVIGSLRNLKSYVVGITFGVLISLFGLFTFGNSFISNLNYWLESLKVFTTSNPSFVVHNNISIVGNFSSIELYLSPERLDNLFFIRYANIIALVILSLLTYSIWKLSKIKNTLWLQSWLLMSALTLITPISYSYNLGLFLIPIGILLWRPDERIFFITKVLDSVLMKSSFMLMIFLTFATKPIRVWLVEGIADTNLFTMFNSLSLFFALILAFRFTRKELSSKSN